MATTAFALVAPTEFYDHRSWTYTYDGPADPDYNCLAYALGLSEWECPWGENLPSDSSVTYWIETFHGYEKILDGQPIQPRIISYGTTDAIWHFSKSNQSLGCSCKAKWGALELFLHGSCNPYNVESDQWGSYYGYKVSSYCF